MSPIYRSIFLFTFSILSILPNQIKAQETNPYAEIKLALPVDIPIFLAGNFAEIRSTHFHAGIDIKTQGKEGFNLYSVDTGYVARISINAGGYGNALYINHPNGVTSVYGHMSEFDPAIAEYVLNEQYSKKRFAMNLFPDKDQFIFSKGQIIGKSGNSGRSMGPHLHFEIRDTKKQEPLNPQFFYNIKDNIAPKIYRFAIYSKDQKGIINGANRTIIQPVEAGVIPEYEVYGPIYFGIDAEDFYNGSRNRCGIYTIELYVDSELIYKSTTDHLNFSESRNIISHIDYKSKLENGYVIQKSYLDPNNDASFYNEISREKGFVNINDSSIHELVYILRDYNGNESVFKAKLRGNTKYSIINPEESFSDKQFRWDEENYFDSLGVSIKFPKNSMFNDLAFTFEALDSIDEFLSKTYRINTPDVPLKKPYSLSLPYYGDTSLLEDIIVVSLDTSRRGESSFSYVGGTLEDDGRISVQTRSFGYFALSIDTIPPSVDDVTNYQSIDSLNSIQIISIDSLSGISSYEGLIDGEWVLFKYDAKSDLFTHDLTERAIDRKKNHLLEFIVEDSRGNLNIYRKEFYY